MLAKIAFNNIWRNKLRSFVVITAIALGLWAGVFASAFMNGMMEQKIASVIDVELSHIQVHQKAFRDEMSPKLFIPNGDEIVEDIAKDSSVHQVAGRIITGGMLASANKTGMVKAIGIEPEHEKEVTTLSEYIKEGTYFEGIKRNPILISTKMAENYHVKLKSKVVLTFQDIEGEITSASFRVVGIYKTSNGMYDEMTAFVNKSDIQQLLQMPEGSLNEIAIRLNNNDLADPKAEEYQERYPELEVLSWLDLGLGMRYMVSIMGTYMTIIVGIILVALLFSIINTMLMAVLERTQELGMLMAIGMAKQKIFFMILYETLFLSFIGTPVGFLLSVLSISYFGDVGIDLHTDAFEDVGYASIIYPSLGINSYVQITIMVFIMSIIAAIYPAKKALSLNPVEAIRKI